MSDKIVSKIFSAEGRENYDKIFRKKEVDKPAYNGYTCPKCGEKRGHRRQGVYFDQQNICFACYHVWDIE